MASGKVIVALRATVKLPRLHRGVGRCAEGDLARAVGDVGLGVAVHGANGVGDDHLIKVRAVRPVGDVQGGRLLTAARGGRGALIVDRGRLRGVARWRRRRRCRWPIARRIRPRCSFRARKGLGVPGAPAAGAGEPRCSPVCRALGVGDAVVVMATLWPLKVNADGGLRGAVGREANRDRSARRESYLVQDGGREGIEAAAAAAERGVPGVGDDVGSIAGWPTSWIRPPTRRWRA